MDVRRAIPILALVGVTVLAFVAVRGLVDAVSSPSGSTAATGDPGAGGGDVEWLEPDEMARLFASPGPHTQDGETVATSVIEAVRLERLQAGSTDAGFSWLAIEPGAAEGTTGMIAVVSGYGDGAYPAWWGMDGQDRPVALLTDFGVLF